MQASLTKDLLLYHPNMDSIASINLLAAFEKGDLTTIREHLTISNVNNSIGVCGHFPIELSIIFNHPHIFTFLIHQLNANTSIRNKTFESLPFIALAYQRHNFLFDLLDLDISGLYECTNDSKRTLMHMAAMYGDVKTVKTLLEYFGFYKNLNEYELKHLVYDKYGCSPLYYACWFGNTKIAELLISASSRPDTKLLKIDLDSGSDDDDHNDDDDDDENEDYIFISDQKWHLSNSVCTNTNQTFSFNDASLSISILHKRFDCSRLLLTRSLKTPCIYIPSNDVKASSELDSWFASAMKLSSDTEFFEMCELFHELVLNGAKFTGQLFGFIDTMTDKIQFKTSSGRSKQIFVYNSYLSYFIRCLTLMGNYDLQRLFNSNKVVELFLKSIFMKINEILLSQNTWQIVDIYLFSGSSNNNEMTSIQFPDSKEYVQRNLSVLEWFIFDFEQLLVSLYSNGHTFKYLPTKEFFNFLRKRKLIYFLIEACLYNEYHSVAVNLDDYVFEGVSRYLDYIQVKFLCWARRPQMVVKPLSLVKLAKIRVKNCLCYLDKDLIAKLLLPEHLKVIVGSGLANGLKNSFKRSSMNFKFNMDKIK